MSEIIKTPAIKLLKFSFFVIPEMNYLLRSDYVNSQHQAYVDKVEYGIYNQTGRNSSFSFKILYESNN